MREPDTFFLFLSGYHNSIKTELIRKIAEQNPRAQWFHFGDIDPDGFLILENLRRRTELTILPWKMGIEELQKYAQYTDKLDPKNDIPKAENLEKHSPEAEVLR